MVRLAEMIARLSEDGADLNNPLVGYTGGPDIPFLDGHTMHCSRATLLAQMDGENIIEFDTHLPYAFLHVESKTFEGRLAAAVINKIDFRNVWTISQNGWFDNGGYSVYVDYKPIAPKFLGFMKKALPLYQFSILRPQGPMIRLHGLKRSEL
ncbi:MAG: hypothetical protein ACKVRN_04535 [Pyrinomonadaceae bacterium]